MDDDFRNRMNHPAIKRQKVAIELGELQRQADEIARLRKQVEAAESIVNQIKAAGVGLRMVGIVNPGEFLIELAESYRATASTEQEADRG